MKSKLSFKQTIVVASTLFGMVFGAGNLIFPVHLGQMAGSNFFIATLGFIVTGVGIPIIGIVAIGYSGSSGLFSLVKKVSKKFAYFFTGLLMLTIGPFFVIPRSSSISYNSGFSVLLQNNINGIDINYVIFGVIFFVIVGFFSFRPSGITVWIGKIINPIFLTFLAILLIFALFNPLGDPSSIAPLENPPSNMYQSKAFFDSFVQGYLTMDVLSGLAFGIIIIDIVKKFGITDKTDITKNTLKAGLITASVMILIYFLTILLGAQSRGTFDLSSNGSIALSNVATYYFGSFGNIFMALIVTLASIKTSIGLVTSCSTTFNKMCPKLSYNIWASIFLTVSFIISNIGLGRIIELSVPVLNFLCPVSIVLIILAFTSKLYNGSRIVLKTTILFTCLSAFLDFYVSLPVDIASILNVSAVESFRNTFLPFAIYGFGWILPTIVGFVTGFIIYKVQSKNKARN